MVASAKGHLAVLRLMLEKKGLEINACDSFGVNAFWIAAFYGHTECMWVLRSAGIDTTVKN